VVCCGRNRRSNGRKRETDAGSRSRRESEPMIVTRAEQLQPNKKGNTNNSETDSSKYLMRFSHFQPCSWRVKRKCRPVVLRLVKRIPQRLEDTNWKRERCHVRRSPHGQRQKLRRVHAINPRSLLSFNRISRLMTSENEPLRTTMIKSALLGTAISIMKHGRPVLHLSSCRRPVLSNKPETQR
jgi:hypothetical protein